MALVAASIFFWGQGSRLERGQVTCSRSPLGNAECWEQVSGLLTVNPVLFPLLDGEAAKREEP